MFRIVEQYRRLLEMGQGNFGHKGRPGLVGGSASNSISKFYLPVNADGSMGGWVQKSDYLTLLKKYNISSEEEESIRQILRAHTFGDFSEKVADEKILVMWDKETVSGPLHRISQIEELMAVKQAKYEGVKIDIEINNYKKLIEKSNKENLNDQEIQDMAWEGGGYNPVTEHESFSAGLPGRNAELETRKEILLLIYRKTSKNESTKRVLSFSRNPNGANTQPLTGGAFLTPNIKMSINDLKRNNLHILFGYAQQSGSSGEDEVLLIRDR
jgi:hypothetical protein